MIQVWENEEGTCEMIYEGKDKKKAEALVAADKNERWLEEVYTAEERAGW
jgi:hypothetical protein